MAKNSKNLISIEMIESASRQLDEIIRKTNLEKNQRLSDKYSANIYFKREDQQIVRSYKIRGAYNLISRLSKEKLEKGIITASAGNHAQGVAFSAQKLKISAMIFMPENTQIQKINKVKKFGGNYVDIRLVGNNFDESNKAALVMSEKTKKTFIPPFDDELIIAGQATVAKEIIDSVSKPIDYIIVPIGGGGLIAGIISYFKVKSPQTKIIGVEPEDAAAMKHSIKHDNVIKLDDIDTFVDGAAVKMVGHKTFNIVKNNVEEIISVSNGELCQEILDLYHEEGIITEPAGALSVAGLEQIAKLIKNKTVVCIISGGNNDANRYKDIIEHALIFQGLKKYYKLNSIDDLKKIEKYIEPKKIILNLQNINQLDGSITISLIYPQKSHNQLVEKFLEKERVNFQSLEK